MKQLFKNVSYRSFIKKFTFPYYIVVLSFFYIEIFGFYFLGRTGGRSWVSPWPLAFSIPWAILLSSFLYLLPRGISRIAYGIVYYAMALYVGFQTGYFILFDEMMWLTEFLYASEGTGYADVLLTYPTTWWAGILVLIFMGILILWKYPKKQPATVKQFLAVLLAAASVAGAALMPKLYFSKNTDDAFSQSDLLRSYSPQAAYENMFSANRLYRICGIYQTLCKDVYTHIIYPLTPGYISAKQEAQKQIDAYFDSRPQSTENAMTGVLSGKNIVLVLMESMDDWMIGEHTPTLSRLMAESINFTNFYTPKFGAVRTFNSEFCINTGSFLSTRGNYSLDYIENAYDHTLPNLLRQNGYHASAFHYNDPAVYSRSSFMPAFGYDAFISYGDYMVQTDAQAKESLLMDDSLLFSDPQLHSLFFQENQPTFNFVITRSAHLSYKYDEVLSAWGFSKYPQYRGLTGNEETDCAYLKAKLVDDFFARMLEELEQQGQLENTVIVGITDHYTYGYLDNDALYELSGVTSPLLLEKTPCFIWSDGLQARNVDTLTSTVDLLPTMLNMLGISSDYRYIGQDAFCENRQDRVFFADGSWIYKDSVYDAQSGALFNLPGKSRTVSMEEQLQLSEESQAFIEINNLILDSDYYKALPFE